MRNLKVAKILLLSVTAFMNYFVLTNEVVSRGLR